MSWLPIQNVAQLSVERILNALPEGCLIALFAWVLLRILRRQNSGTQNSGTRFAVWFFALLTVAALPVLGGFGGRTLVASGMSWVGLSGESTSLATMPLPSPLGTVAPALTIPARWALFVFLAWALGSGIALLRLTAGLLRLGRLRRSCTPVTVADIDPAVRETVDAIRRSNGVTIAISENVRVPAAIGFWKRTIVLPAWALKELPASDLNVILLHELAHLRRWDAWTNLIQKIVRSIFFFHPAVWWIENRLSVEREMACDDAVLAQTANPHGYATCLVSLLEKSLAHRPGLRRGHSSGQGPWSMAQAAVHRAREAALRLAQILDKNRPVATRVWRPALAIVASFSMLCLVEMPHAPRFIAFDRGMPEHNSVREYSASAASVKPVMEMARVIPAALRSDGPPSTAPTPKVVHPRVPARKADERQLSQTQLVAARWNEAANRAISETVSETTPGDRVVQTSARAEQESAPQLRTVVFMEATQYQTSGALVWNVQIWRVTLLSQARERLARVPVASKT